MTIGQLSAFLAYLTILVFPIIIIGFTSRVDQSGPGLVHGRIPAPVLNAPPPPARSRSEPSP